MTDDGSDWLEPDPASQPEARDDSAGRMARGPWFVRFAGRRSGPFDAERLRTMARRKALTRMHAVSVDGTTWASAVTLRAVALPAAASAAGMRVVGLAAGASAAVLAVTAAPSNAAASAMVYATIPAAATYKTGQTLSFTVTFTEAVLVTGVPRLQAVIGTTLRSITYVRGTGTKSLVFSYKIQATDKDADGIALQSQIVLGTGTIRDRGGNPTILTLPSIVTSGVKVG
jgi:hypothetical protein